MFKRIRFAAGHFLGAWICFSEIKHDCDALSEDRAERCRYCHAVHVYQVGTIGAMRYDAKHAKVARDLGVAVPR